MSIETIALMSLRVSIVPYIVGAKEVFIFLTMKYLSESFQKNIYCHFEFEHDIEKTMAGVQEVIHIEKIIQKLKKNVYPLFINEMGS